MRSGGGSTMHMGSRQMLGVDAVEMPALHRSKRDNEAVEKEHLFHFGGAIQLRRPLQHDGRVRRRSPDRAGEGVQADAKALKGERLDRGGHHRVQQPRGLVAAR